MKYLTKSRFKVASTCPTKLYYLDRPEYGNNLQDNEFMAALAEGGFQVGALAKAYYPGGVDLESLSGAEAIRRTEELLQEDSVTVFEAAIQIGHFLVRVDILEKKGDYINLIEVKAKSHDFEAPDFFKTKSGKKNAELGSTIDTEWEPYLVDVAFQTYVTQKKYPNFKISPYLFLIDKRKQITVDGLHQLFLIRRENGRPKVFTKNGLTPDQLGEPILSLADVRAEVDFLMDKEIFPGPVEMGLYTYADYLSRLMLKGEKAPPRPTKECKSCEFRIKASRMDSGKLSGFQECWLEAGVLDPDRLRDPLVIDLWDNRRASRQLKDGKIYLDELGLDDIAGKEPKEESQGLSRTERQWLQVRYAKKELTETYVDQGYVESFLRGLTYPLHMIDFETAMVAIPFHENLRPYEQLAYQFSHHVMYEDGRIEHKTQFLHVKPGEFPNFEFVRALKAALGDKGTIFRYAAHENTVLNDIRRQLEVFQPDDWQELCAFIRTITHVKEEGAVVVGPRAMQDLRKVILACFYDPKMGGSNSIKAVTPTLLSISSHLRDKYSKAIYGKGALIPSLNFQPHAWVQFRADGSVIDPYSSLPPVAVVEGQNLVDMEQIKEGGGASIAWARMQFTEMSDLERRALSDALLRYCELDTLAMVWIVEYLKILT